MRRIGLVIPICPTAAQFQLSTKKSLRGFPFGRSFLRLEQLLNRQVAEWAAGGVEHDNAAFLQLPHGQEIAETISMTAILVVAKQDCFSAHAIRLGIERCQQRENVLANLVWVILLHAIALPVDCLNRRTIAGKTIVLLQHRQARTIEPLAKS